MVELHIETTIPSEYTLRHSADELEQMIQTQIMDKLCEEIDDNLDDISFVDMQMSGDGDVEIMAELVLCSKQQIVTTAEVQAQKLAGYGLTEEQILDVLETQLEDTHGF